MLIRDFDRDDPQIAAVVQILRRVRPDVVLINEIDHDPQARSVTRLIEVLAAGADDALELPYFFAAPVNTGTPSGHDLDGDGTVMGPADALGWGRFPGQYGMAILSRFPLGRARTFRKLLWSDMPGAIPPSLPGGEPFWSEDVWQSLRLSSKSHWDVEFELPDGRSLHLLASHPTPPVFDGPENRNGLRNAAEIRFWTDYLSGAEWMTDDAGETGALPSDASFVLLGDLNADPARGSGHRATITALLAHERLVDPAPVSPGGREAGAREATADWRYGAGTPGAMRVDYVLPSRDLDFAGAGVFWPGASDTLAELVGHSGKRHTSSDHRLVWIDIRVGD